MKEKVNNLVLFDKVRTKTTKKKEKKKAFFNERKKTRKLKKNSPFFLSLLLHSAPPINQATYDKLIQEVPKYKMITPSILSDRLRINGSLARAAIRHLVDEGAIRPIVESHHQYIYTRATNA